MGCNKSGGEAPGAAAARSDGNGGGRRLDEAPVGAYGVLLRRVVASALNFTFTWRGVDFTGRFDAREGGIRLTLRGTLTELPYSAEDAEARKVLLAVADTCDGGDVAKFRVECGQKIIIEDSVSLTETDGDTVASIVTDLTMLVLRLAPCLDLLAEHASAGEGRRVANAVS